MTDRKSDVDTLDQAVGTVEKTLVVQSALEERAVKPAIYKGLRKRCPNCGTGKLFQGYLKVNDSCPVCHEELYHQRADDGPAYLTILLVGHLMAPALHITYVNFVQDPRVLASIFTVATVTLSLFLLPRLKGLMVGIQWAKRMHGFSKAKVNTA